MGNSCETKMEPCETRMVDGVDEMVVAKSGQETYAGVFSQVSFDTDEHTQTGGGAHTVRTEGASRPDVFFPCGPSSCRTCEEVRDACPGRLSPRVVSLREVRPSPLAAVLNEEVDRNGAGVPIESLRTTERLLVWERGVFKDRGLTYERPALCDSPRPDAEKPTSVAFVAMSVGHDSTSTRVTLLFNDTQVLAEDFVLDQEFRLFHFDVPVCVPVWNIVFRVEPAPEGWVAGQVLLDASFGFQVNGENLLDLARLETDDMAERELWALRGRAGIGEQAMARQGLINVVPASLIVETALEFVVRGLSSRERVDVFANGLTVPLVKGARPGSVEYPKLMRFAFAPLVSTVRSLIIAVRSSGERARGMSDVPDTVLVEASFGVMLAGQDCLPSVELVNAKGERNPEGWTSQCQEYKDMKSGVWGFPGYYYMLPYRRSRKPIARIAGGHDDGRPASPVRRCPTRDHEARGFQQSSIKPVFPSRKLPVPEPVAGEVESQAPVSG